MAFHFEVKRTVDECGEKSTAVALSWDRCFLRFHANLNPLKLLTILLYIYSETSRIGI